MRATFWVFEFKSTVVNGMLLCEMVDNSSMQKDEGVGEVDISDVNVAVSRKPGRLCNHAASTSPQFFT